MLTDHSQVAIAQIAFYVPAVILAAILLFYRHGRPRLAWYILQVFCLIRIACGIVVIVYQNNRSSVGLTIAALILQNAGLFPLIAATIGLVRIIIQKDFDHNKALGRSVVFSRLLFLIGIVLLVAGGSLEGNTTNINDVETGLKLVKAGYIIVAVFVGTLVAQQGYFWMNYSYLSRPSITVLKGMGLAVPFLIIRITWLFLTVYQPSEKWDNLNGPIGPFVAMACIMEYCVVCIYIATGFLIPATKGTHIQQYVQQDGQKASGTVSDGGVYLREV